MIKIFVGYDAREALAFSVLSFSIHVRSTQPVSVTPLMLAQLKNVFSRPRDPLQSTDFSFSRFLTPYLCDYEGWALFMDSDMLCRDDIVKLWSLRDERYAVMCVKHEHVAKETIKFLNEPQSKYARKNWSSLMLFNCAKCKNLTLDYVNGASGLDLHQFKWLETEDMIGGLPQQWNHLVGVDAPNENASIVHHTLGGPYFNELRDCEYSDAWFAEVQAMQHVDQRPDATMHQI